LQRRACHVAHRLGILSKYLRGDSAAIDEVAECLGAASAFFELPENNFEL
jgi:hypothetical protein